jgi:hypothetical protein
MKKLIFSIIVILFFFKVSAQEKRSIGAIKKEADNDYNSKNYKSATDKYLKVIELSDFKSQKQSATYNAACCLALQKKK